MYSTFQVRPVNMSLKSFLLIALFCFVSINEASDLLKEISNSRSILLKFVDLVQANQLNVSIVTSRGQLWSNGQLRDLKDNVLLISPNNIHLTKSSLTSEVGKQWLADLKPWSNNIIATFRSQSLGDGSASNTIIESSNQEAIPISPSYENIVAVDEQAKLTGLQTDLPDYEMNYNLLIPVGSGQNKTVNVLTASINITVVDHSKLLPTQKVNAMKPLIAQVWVMTTDLNLIAEYIAQALNAELPVPQSSWQVAIGPESVSFTSSSQWVNLIVSSTPMVIFTVGQQ